MIDLSIRAKVASHRRTQVGEFGDKFRKTRETKGISLDDVSQVTKISSRMLKAIEDEHFDQLPGGVFNKGFIRAYAKHLGLNDEEAITDYLACLRQAQIDANKAWESPPPMPPRAASSQKGPLAAPLKPDLKQRPTAQVEELPELQLPRAEDIRPPRILFAEKRDSGVPWRILVLAGVVMILALVLWNRHSHRPRTEAVAASPAPPVPATPSAPAPLTAPANPSLGSPAAHAASPRASAPNSQPPQTSRLATATHSSAPTPATPPAGAAQNDLAIRSAGKLTPLPSAKPATSLALVIRATENSWISILADGQAVSQETLIAPAHYSVHASREIVAKVGNAAGVTFLWNGQEIPAQGAEAEVKTFVFDAAGMRLASPGQAP